MSAYNKRDWVIKRMIKDGYYVTKGSLMHPDGKKKYIHRPLREDRYNQVRVSYDGYRYDLPHARVLLLMTVGDPPTEHHVADHINHDRHDDRLENLRWLHVRDNNRHVTDKDRERRKQSAKKLSEMRKGKKNKKKLARIKTAEATAIRAKYAAGKFISALAAEYGATRETISNIINNLNWRGYDWREYA